jgi:hypothetical protein
MRHLGTWLLQKAGAASLVRIGNQRLGPLPPEQLLKSRQFFGKEVIPAFTTSE